jgi:hypothetical protein
VKLPKEDYWKIQRMMEKFYGIGGMVTVKFTPGKLDKISASVEVDCSELPVPPSLDHPDKTIIVDAQD